MACPWHFHYTLLEELNTMLNKLFRPKWLHENPEIRKNALSRLDKNETAALKEIALNDTDANIRQLAISKIEDLALLQTLTNDCPSENDREFALKCWANYLTLNDELSPVDVENFILDCQNEKLLAGIIAYCENQALKELALSGIKSETQLLSLMNNTKNGRVWQAIIEKLSSEDTLKKALAIVNGRDKKSQQTIKNKLDSLKANQLIAQNNEKNADILFNKLNHLLKSAFNPLYEGILLTIKQQWYALEKNVSTEKAHTIDMLIIQCEQRLSNEHQRKDSINKEASQITEDHAAHTDLLNQLRNLKTQALTAGIITDALASEKDILTAHWMAIKLQPGKNEQATFNKLVSDINTLIEVESRYKDKNLRFKLSNDHISSLGMTEIDECIEHLKLIIGLFKKSSLDIDNVFLYASEQLLETATQHKKDLSQQNKKLHQDIEKILNDVENLIDKKELTHAQKKFSQIKNTLSRLPAHEKHKYSNSIQRVFNAIKTLEDWKNYSNDEKRLELCSRMKNLIDDNSHVLEKADSINAMQQEWKSLGHCHDKELWLQFKSFADEAYLPCQQYFEAQKKIRTFNAEQREIICNQLEIFMDEQDWDIIDWKSLDKIYQSVQDEWKKYSPVERHDHQRLENRFFKNTRLIKEKINGERKKNTEKLMDLVQQAENLLNEIDAQRAIEHYTKLQHEWKNIGITFQKQQHDQWQAFKKAGDALYEKRQNIRKEADHDRQENLKMALELCQKILDLGLLPDAELANSKPIFEKLKSDFKGLGSLPKDKFNNSMQNFHNACDAYEHNYKSINKRQWLGQFENLVSLGNSWLTQELNHENYVSSLVDNRLPEKWLKRLEPRFKPDTPKSNEEYARTLCIEIEMLAGIETPAEDTTLKMQWQLSKLAKNFGQLQSHSEKEQIVDLYLRWFAQKNWDTDSYKQLQKRFLNTAELLLKKQL
jgi:DNA repair protein SbcC/Rad50